MPSNQQKISASQSHDQAPVPSYSNLPPEAVHSSSSHFKNNYEYHNVPDGLKHENIPKRKYNDLAFAVAFIVHLLGVVAMVLASFFMKPEEQTQASGLTQVEITQICIAAVTGLFIASGGSVLFFVLLNWYPLTTIKLSFFVPIALYIALAVYYALNSNAYFMIPAAIFIILNLLAYYFLRKKIPFTALILEYVTTVLSGYKRMFFMVPIAYATIGLYIFLLSFGVQNVKSLSKGMIVFGGIYTTLSVFWTLQVIVNVMKTTISGVFATHFYVSGSGQIVPSPVMNSAKRAMTTSFGSICLGSLIMAALQTLQALFQDHRDRHNVVRAGCTILEDLLELFNKYVFAQVAIHGEPYIKSAKSAGLDALAQEVILPQVFFLGALCLAAMNAAIMYLILSGMVAMNIMVYVVVAMVVFSLVCVGIIAQFVDAGATTMFLCIAQDPWTLKGNNPLLFQKISIVNPKILKV